MVTDGFTGNVVLKSVEGAGGGDPGHGQARRSCASALLAKLGARADDAALRRLKRRTDYAEHGGAPLLGVDGVALICHGGSNAKAIKNAVYVADRLRADRPRARS